MPIVTTDAPAEQHPRTDNVTPIRFVRVCVDLLPLLCDFSLVEVLTYLELVSRCDGWKRRNIAPPFVRAADVARAIKMSERRVQLAIGELLRRRLVIRIGGKARDTRGCQYEISSPDILGLHTDPPGSVCDEVDRSARIGVEVVRPIRTDHCAGDHTLLSSRSIDPCQPRSRAGARGAGGPSVDFRPENNLDDLERQIVVLFDPRWHRFGAKLIRRKLSELRDLAAPELVVSFCKSQLRRPDVQNAQYTPSVALCREDFARWLKAREREARNEALTSAPAAPRIETRPPPELASRAEAIRHVRPGAPRPR
jgi:hypothetical protein